MEAAGLATFLIILALVFCYLFLVALYESWMLAFAVMFSTVFAILGALVGLHLMGQSLSIYAQLGLIMLIWSGRQKRHFDCRVYQGLP